MSKVAFALAAHPDDIEFMMAGTLALLGRAGYELHMMNIANGCCGSMVEGREATAKRRWEEAQASARVLGAGAHPPIANDLEILYSQDLILKLTAVMREVKPTILLLHSPQDYMEDHMNASRLGVSSAFVRGMPNVESDPPRAPWGGEVTVYHALPHGLRDGLRRRIPAGQYVDVSEVIELKRAALACHASQKEWLDQTQGMDSYLKAMEETSAEVGRCSGRFAHAEGWRRHAHLGFCAADADPLGDALGALHWADPAYEAALDDGM